MMSGAVSGIDHLVVLVANLDAAERRWREFGFALSPRGYHDRIGTSNHLVGLRTGYLELLGIHLPTDANEVYANAIARRPGAWGIAFRGEAQAAFEKLRAAGVHATPPQKLTRPVEMHGTAHVAEFHLTHLSPEVVPGTLCFICEHKTPELVWQQAWMTHANTATCLRSLTCVGQDAAWIRRFETLSGNAARLDACGDLHVPFGTQSLRFLDTATFSRRYGLDANLNPAAEPYIGSVLVDVESLDAARAALSQTGMQIRRLDARRIALVDAVDGLVIEFAA